MTANLIQFSIVVAANDHNPTILNPDFLAIQNIVPNSWDWEIQGPAITTPAFATVAYSSGIIVTVEPNKLQIVDQSDLIDPADSKAVNIARKYVEILPHVRYSAVGLNFRGFSEKAQPDEFLMNHFLKSGQWGNEDNTLATLNLTLNYPLEGGKLSISLEGGALVNRAEAGETRNPGILSSANFHRDCQGYPAGEQVTSHLDNVNQDWNRYQKLLSDILKS